jgi:prepilin-type N-terminal cleavage/methylation domain-containing protein
MMTTTTTYKPFKPGRRDGGFTLIEIIVVTAIIAILVSIALPAYNAFIQRAKETAVISYLSKAKKAQEVFRLTDPVEQYSASFDELEVTGFVEDSVGGASRVEHEYQLDLVAGVSLGESVWNIVASPVTFTPKARHFYVDQTGVMRYAVGAPAGPGSPPL